MPQISTPIRNVPVRDINKFPHLQNIKLAHPPTDDKTSDITVLIGADYYWDIVVNHTIRGNGPTAVASKLGYLLSGPCYNNDIYQDTSTFFINAQPKQLDDISTRFWDLQSIGITDTREENKDDVHSFQDKFIKRENNHYVAKAPISLVWRLVGDLLATRVSVGRGDVAATSPGDLAGREGVAVKSNMFDFFCDSLETFSSLQLVSETSRRRRSD